ncbi:hypothetical protein CC2G_000082 [Coprinopsis cinerea AmutBmut pab1-1]|nr:hypothetical protein CC2G_000082 [Coprinopsis cinerea AmutBmut pab1-1]
MAIERLPPELLGEIFKECALLNPDAPYVLSLVSRTFHSVVRSTPAAWKKLQLRVYEGEDPKAQQKAALWFSMLGTCMADVTVDINPSSTPLSDFFLKDVAPPKFGATDVLRRYTHRIESLSVEAASECDARSFVNAVYDEYEAVQHTRRQKHATFALTSLSIEISSTAPPTQWASSIPVPHLPNLRNLKLLNHSIAFLASRRFDQLHHLSITRPIRFVPFSLLTVFGILRSAPRLQTLSIESRILDDTASVSGVDHPGGSLSLIHLPFLTSLSLRTNLVPSILSLLLLPNLSKLHVDDLNGRRVGRSRETASVLRQVLVRMELPNEHRTSTGLKQLELVGVEVYAKDQRAGSERNDAWEWCFNRMRALERLSVSKVDSAPVLDILSTLACPSSPPPGSIPFASPSSSSKRLEDDMHDPDYPCPNLRSLTLKDTYGTPWNFDSFRNARPSVQLTFEEPDVSAFSPSGSVFNSYAPSRSGTPVPLSRSPSRGGVSPPPIDFLSLYTDLQHSPAGSPWSPKSSRSSGSPLPRFGPWLVLAQKPEN